MLVRGIANDSVHQKNESSFALRDGQVTLAKVTKIYPNQHAEVQIGSNRLLAQIETPLVVGEPYLFQVEVQPDQTIRLRVIGSEVSQLNQETLLAILRQLDVPINQASLQLLHRLIREQIPFTQQQLVAALQLVNKLQDLPNVNDWLTRMVANNLPLQEAYIRAMHSVESQSLSDVLHQASDQLQLARQTPALANLQSSILSLLYPANQAIANRLSTDELGAMVRTMHLLGLIQQPIGSSLASLFEKLENEPGKEAVLKELFQALQAYAKGSHANHSILQVVQAYRPLVNAASALLLEFPLASFSRMTGSELTQLKAKMDTEILSLLENTLQARLRSHLQGGRATQVTNIQSLLQAFSNNHFYSILMESIIASQVTSKAQDDGIPERFMLHLSQVLESLGLSQEASLRHLPLQESPKLGNLALMQQSIKSMIMNLLQDDKVRLESLQQVLHFMNGMQLQAREDQNLLHAHLQLPGEKLGLPEDLYLKFEGRKTKEDQMDTDFCRVLFFLNLHHIEETIIDMQVQKRIVSLTIYNDHAEGLARQSHSFKPLLEEGLSRIDYRLSAINFKGLQDREQDLPSKLDTSHLSGESVEGFDIKI